MFIPGGEFEANGRWFRGFWHREETARGLDDVSDAFAIGEVKATIEPGRPFTIVFTTEPGTPEPSEPALRATIDRQASLIRAAGAEHGSAFLRGLVVAADQFLVARDIPLADALADGDRVEHGRTVIAGYPWFPDRQHL